MGAVKKQKRLLLPCLTGTFGSWRYYNVVMKVKDVVNPQSGIKTIPEAKKIYTSDNLNTILQRLENLKRIEPIKAYILNQNDRYFNSLTAAITNGDPQWHPVSIKEGKDDDFTSKEVEYLNLKYGILELKGGEEIFILDGQHRLLGLKEAFKAEKAIGEEEVSVMLIVHHPTDEGLKRLRRVFVSLNRHAQPVSEGENIILEEDDASAIIARNLIERYPLFHEHNSIAFNKNLNLMPGKKDVDKFTSMLALYNINEHIIDNSKLYNNKINGKYVRIRPAETLIESAYSQVENFWNKFFKTFPDAKDFIQNPSNNAELKLNNGGKYYMRPIGQEIIVQFYVFLKSRKQIKAFDRIKEVESDLDSDFWNYVLHNPHRKGRVVMNKANAFNYLLYNFGYDIGGNLVRLKKDYREKSGELKLDLPPPKFA